ncbi:MAG: hypothetical protein KC613_09805, partial [Myxococcales bacterium]|nr:hypothetical protein [Myxococcales bacterium]
MQHTGSRLDDVVLKLPLPVRRRVEAWADHVETLLSVHNPQVMARLGPAAFRGLFLRRGRRGPVAMPAHHSAWFDFDYPKDDPQLAALYEKAKRLQWNGSTDLPWQTSVDPLDPEVPLIEAGFLPWDLIEQHTGPLEARTRMGLRHKVTAWMLSQFLHGEQGALMASAQVTEATPSMDGKFYGATQVMDEA